MTATHILGEKLDAITTAQDDLSRISKQLAGLSVLLYGDTDSQFKSLAPKAQDHILWLVSDLAHRIEELVPVACGFKVAKHG